MVEGINSLESVSLSMNSFMPGSPSVPENGNISGHLQAEMKNLGIDVTVIKSEIEAKAAIIKAQNEIMQEAINLGSDNSADIQDTAEISQSYTNHAAVMKSIGQ